jgi:heptosyltransferase-1
MRHNNPRRILITRLSHIGDCILTMPVLNALRARFPKAFISWVVESPAAPLLRKHEALDELIVLRRGWWKSPSSVWRIRRELRQHNFDTAIDPQGLTKSSLLGWLSGASTRIGFAGQEGRELSRWLNNRLVARTATHVVDRSLELLQPLGIERPRVQFRVPIDEVSQSFADSYLRQQKLMGGCAIINPGAGWDSRLWPAENYGRVARHLGQQRSLPSIVAWAGEKERLMAEQIVAGSAGYSRMAPRTSLLELAALLKRARLYVGSDTGPMHLAAAVATPCVALFGPTLAAQSGPYGEGHVTVQETYHAGTSRERRSAGNEAMKAIGIERVCEACDHLLVGSTAYVNERRVA